MMSSHQRLVSSSFGSSSSSLCGGGGPHGMRRSSSSSSRPRRFHARHSRTCAQLTEIGEKLDPARVAWLGDKLGEGSYGVVYEGELSGPTQRVVLKRVRPRVEWAEEFAEMERKLNAYVSKAAPGSCAPYLGSIEVPQNYVGNAPGTRLLRPGTWLVWQHEGTETLETIIGKPRNKALVELAKALDCDDELAAARTAFRQLVQSVQRLHIAGLVHRDVKPANIVLATNHRQLRLVDLGAACDLRMGTNFVPQEAVLDIMYSPPEKFVVPPETELDFSAAPGGRVGASALLSPLVWRRFEPGLFDSWSLGITLMQVCIPKLRTPRGLKAFNQELKNAGYELSRWRETYGERLTEKETWVLDAEGAMGWDLVEKLITPRLRPSSSLDSSDLEGSIYEVMGEAAIYRDAGPQRMSVDAALQHPFLAGASRSSSPSTLAYADKSPIRSSESKGSGEGTGVMGLFGFLTGGTGADRVRSDPPVERRKSGGSGWVGGGRADSSAARNGGGGSTGASAEEVELPDEGTRVSGADLKKANQRCDASNPPRRGERVAVLRTNGQWQHAKAMAGAPWGFVRLSLGVVDETNLLVKDIAAEDLASSVRRWVDGMPPVPAPPRRSARRGGQGDNLWNLAVDLLNLERRVGTARGTARKLAEKKVNEDTSSVEPAAAEAQLTELQSQLANLAQGLMESVTGTSGEKVKTRSAASSDKPAVQAVKLAEKPEPKKVEPVTEVEVVGAPEPVDDLERGARDAVVGAVRTVGAFGGLAARVVSDVLTEAFGGDVKDAKSEEEEPETIRATAERKSTGEDVQDVQEEQEEGNEEYGRMRAKLRLLEEQVQMLESQMETMASPGKSDDPPSSSSSSSSSSTVASAGWVNEVANEVVEQEEEATASTALAEKQEEETTATAAEEEEETTAAQS